MSKFNNKKLKVGNMTFDSTKEYRRYQELVLLQRAKKIHNLQRQVKFVLVDGFSIGKKRFQPITYIADFTYEQNGAFIVEDVKGVETDVFRIKAKLFRRRYGQEIKIVR